LRLSVALSTVFAVVTVVSAPALDQRVLDAAITCISRWGASKTTLEDIAREAGCSRATVYRLFPGGKDSLFRAVVVSEVSRFFDAIDLQLRGAGSLEDLLSAGVNEALLRLRAHSALQYVLHHELPTLVPGPASPAMGHVIDVAAAFTAERLRGWLPEARISSAADWVVRCTLSYALIPARGVGQDTHEAWVRTLVRDLLLPALSPVFPPTPTRS